MSSVSDHLSSTDDELPLLENLLRLGTQNMKSSSTEVATNVADRRNAILKPTSTSSSSSHKVRRLGGGKSPSSNPLFLPLSRRMKDDFKGSSASIGNERTVESRKGQPCPSNHKCPALPHFTGPPARSSLAYRIGDSPATKEEAQTSKAREVSMPAAATRQIAAPFVRNGQLVEKTLRKKARKQHQRTEADAGTQKGALDSEKEESTIYQTAVEDTSGESDGSLWESGLDVSSDDFFEELEPKISQSRGKGITGQLGLKDSCPRASRQSRRHVAEESPRASRAPVEVTKTHTRRNECRSYLGDSSDDETPPLEQRINLRTLGSPLRESRSRNLISPRKLALIPETPHRPSVDAFWSQDFVNDWNDHHSPRKPFRPPSVANPIKITSVEASPAKRSPTKTASKKSFDAKKRSLAEEFLRELDTQITQGKISELAESAGGVKLVWTKTLNTTAGRANWKRETTRTRLASGETKNVTHKHHALIELAEKVIDDENKLLNVLAHEFCHLANFMISGVINNPHGREFKAWAAKCSRAFGDSRGICVTTKHTYEIAFKFVWECPACGFEYKRHSKSIDPRRHRCGCYKGVLVQTRPVPRRTGNATDGSKLTEYQTFVKQEMMSVRGENPSILQKEVMRIVAERWAKHKKGLAPADTTSEHGIVDGVVEQMTHITLQD